MPADYITLKALTAELHDALCQGKIDKINMPERDEIVLTVRARGVNNLLDISCDASDPFIRLSRVKKVNPQDAPAFCMHLRRRLSGGVIERIETLNTDRIVALTVVNRNEMRDEVRYKLIAEMMGRYSNILLTDEAGVITDAVKLASFDCATKRCLFPGARYEAPPQSKTLPGDPSLEALLQSYGGKNLPLFLCGNIAGIAPPTARELAHACGVAPDAASLSGTQTRRLIRGLRELLSIYGTDAFRPCYSPAAGDWFIKPYAEFPDAQPCASLSEAWEACNADKERERRRKERTKFLQKAYKSLLSRTEKKVAKCRERLLETEGMDAYKRCGDLLTAHLGEVRRGAESVSLPDWNDDYRPVAIKLDARLSPQQNAQQYYKKYAKLKRAKAIVSEQLTALETQAEYIRSIAPSIEIAASPEEIAEVSRELERCGALRAQKQSGKKKIKPAAPFYYQIGEFTVAVGKNNLQNETLTFKLAGGGDLWIHAKNIHGSHVVVFTEGRSVPTDVLETACEICAYYSDGRQSPKVECDYTPRKNVKRHPCGNPGMTLYEVYKTMLVAPDAHAELLKK